MAGKNLAENTLVVVQGHGHPSLQKGWLEADQLSWIAEASPEARAGYGAKSRYRQQDAACTLAFEDPASLTLRFSEPQWAITPGQSAVLYDGEVCLGGGIITA